MVDGTRGNARPKLRCAIYTRKSTEEGLDQDFNSLDAQREACAAYILSQRHEGWSLVPEFYDDGGYSGGNMDRPGLRALLAAVGAGKVDVIVVYKVDRLTRSLADFAKIVEVLDAKGASFVSVTQSFNTTSSMGRLTLNVLLSFAQFEREVTGERIRDKVAASKARGMWMGGPVPLGYRLQDRKLHIDAEEAEKIRYIFARYLELGSGRLVVAELDRQGIRSKPRRNRHGREYGNTTIGRGALYAILQNRLYVGEVSHKRQNYPGQHEGIVARETFEAVQQCLERARVERRLGINADQPSLLAGLLWDGRGRRMSPSHCTTRQRRYRYYVSQTDDPSITEPCWRVSAPDIEMLVTERLKIMINQASHRAVASGALIADAILLLNESIADLETKLDQPATSAKRALLLSFVQRIDLIGDTLRITIDLSPVDPALSGNACDEVAIGFVRSAKQVRLIVPPSSTQTEQPRNPSLLKLIAQAFIARREVEKGGSFQEVADRLGYGREYLADMIRISYLSPAIITAILNGAQPQALNRRQLVQTVRLPLDWAEQQQLFGVA